MQTGITSGFSPCRKTSTETASRPPSRTVSCNSSCRRQKLQKQERSNSKPLERRTQWLEERVETGNSAFPPYLTTRVRARRARVGCVGSRRRDGAAQASPLGRDFAGPATAIRRRRNAAPQKS